VRIVKVSNSLPVEMVTAESIHVFKLLLENQKILINLLLAKKTLNITANLSFHAKLLFEVSIFNQLSNCIIIQNLYLYNI